MLGRAYQNQVIFKTHFGNSWVEAMEAFTDVTKLVEAFGRVFLLNKNEYTNNLILLHMYI